MGSAGRSDRERARLRSWWLRRQCLTSETRPRTIEACVRQTGWLPTAGGPGAYLSVRARMPGVSRDAIDRAAIDGKPLVEVPGAHARPPMLVPRDEMALALRLHRAVFQRHIAPLVRSGDIDPAAVQRLGSAVVRALEEGPLSSADIRKVLKRDDEGATLTGALIDLSLRGIIRRFPADARIDSPKYLYEWLHPDDRPDLEGEGDAAAVTRHLAGRFLRWHGPATLDELGAWAELTKKAARTALDALGAEPVRVAGWAGEAWLLPGDARLWRAFGEAAPLEARFLPYRDPFVSARRGPAILTEHPDAPVLDRNTRLSRLADVTGLHHHVIVYGAELIGAWEYDPDDRAVVTRVWSTGRHVTQRVAEAARETERFIRNELGDARLAAVDPPAARARRLAFCRDAGRPAPRRR